MGLPRKRLSALALAAIVFPTLAACGSDDTTDGSSDEATGGGEAEVEEFYSENDITIMVGFGEGGGYDTATRLFARHFGDFVPGNPKITVINNPGAGSLNNANEVYNQSPNDGSVIGVNHRDLITGQLFEQQGINFDHRDAEWVGGIGTSQNVAIVRSDVTDDPEAAKEMEIIFGVTSPGTSTYGGAVIMQQLLGWDQLKIIPGYEDAGSLRIAVEGGEVDGFVSGVEPYIVQNSDWIENDFTTELVILGPDRDDRLPDVPSMYEFLETDEQKQVADLFTAPGVLGYAFSLPPGTPENIVEALQQAHQEMLEDPDFQADAEELNFSLAGSPSGEQIKETIAKVFETPQEQIDLFKSYMQPE